MGRYVVLDEEGYNLKIDTMDDLVGYICHKDSPVVIDFSGTHDVIVVSSVPSHFSEEYINFDDVFDKGKEEEE